MAKKSASTALAPAAALAAPASASDRFFKNPHAAPAVETFTKALGGRGQLAADLLTSPDLTPTIRKVLTLILDPRFDAYPLAQLCHSAQITPGEFFRAFKDATLAKANIEALQKVASHLVEITEQLLQDAVNHTVVCDECNGSKQQRYPATKKEPEQIGPCLRCNGQGEIPLRADFEKQKIALELGGLLKKPGTTIQQNLQQNTLIANQQAQSGSSAGLVQLQQAAASILYNREPITLAEEDDPPVPVLDAEVTSV